MVLSERVNHLLLPFTNKYKEVLWFQMYLMPIILLFNQRCIPRDIWAVPSFCYTLYMSFFWCSLTKISLLVVFLLMQCIYKPVFNGFSFYLLLLFCLHWNTKNSMCWISILINPISYIRIHNSYICIIFFENIIRGLIILSPEFFLMFCYLFFFFLFQSSKYEFKIYTE